MLFGCIPSILAILLLIKYPEKKLLGLLRLKQNNKKSEALIMNEDADQNIFAVSPNGSITGKSSPNIGGNKEYKHISALILDHFSLYQLGLLLDGDYYGIKRLRIHLICWLVIWLIVFSGGISGSIMIILYLGQKYFSFVSIMVLHFWR